MPRPRKPGTVPKDSLITNSVNENKSNKLTQRQIAAIERQAKLKKEKLLAQKDKSEDAFDKLNEQIEALGKKAGFIADTPDSPDTNISPDDLTKEDLKFFSQLASDLRYVYQKSNGKKRLLELAKSDNRFLIAMVKEMLKVEAAMNAAKMKYHNPDEGEKVVFVVLRGLEDEKKLKQKVEEIEGEIDHEQIGKVLAMDDSWKDDNKKDDKDEGEFNGSIGGQNAPEGW